MTLFHIERRHAFMIPEIYHELLHGLLMQ